MTEQRKYLAGTNIELCNPTIERGNIRHVVFDFDGTLSMIREGWQKIMIPMGVEFLQETGTDESEEQLYAVVNEFVTRLTGKQTIYQMIELAQEITKRGGTPKDPLEYKHIYLDRLWERIKHRVEVLK
jgi:phosphoglycolate phosphatase-like HAD superfamily hydrolase